ncbi:MAG: DNA integrity scanning protein DisA nucleotide-binding domain protein [Candidatus Zapsychrus exili]|nr:DNA integrity scanning protein DisA nucleotide-binding domain protein [Candidatus Zapsychrus exili]
MSRAIKLFMWGYQPHFRLSLEVKAKDVIQSIAPTLEPKALLIGVRIPEKKDDYPVCVEPENEGWDPKIFFECAKRTEAIYKEHPDHSIIYGDEPSMRDMPENIRKKSVRQSVKEAVSLYDSQNKTISFCGLPTRVEGYHVVPVLQFNRAQVFEYPHLPKPILFEKYESSIGILHNVILCLLEEATEMLEKKEPGRFFNTFPKEKTSILRKAGDDFCYAITLCTGDLILRDIFDSLNIVSSLPYEGEAAIGRMLFCSSKEKNVKLQVQLKDKIPIHNHKLARKMIEISGKDLFCVCRGGDKFPGINNGITGFGTLESSNMENVFRIDFTGRYRWEMYYNNNLLMNVSYGIPWLPLKRLNEEVFRSDIKRIIQKILKDAENRIWSVVSAAIDQKKGTMIVVSTRAKEEAERLKKQCLMVNPIEVTPELVSRLSGIDGAILIDSKGVCYAIGVILDGKATDEGDQSRGARYNSAIRYIASNEHPTICIVVSEDGHVDVFPKLFPKIDKAEVEGMVTLLQSNVKEDCIKAKHWLGEHRFYITQEQCEVINTRLGQMENIKMEEGEVSFIITSFIHDEKMNDSYYL